MYHANVIVGGVGVYLKLLDDTKWELSRKKGV